MALMRKAGSSALLRVGSALAGAAACCCPEYAPCEECGPDGALPPVAWLLDFSALVSGPVLSCDDCPGSTVLSVVVPFDAFQDIGSGLSRCRYQLAIACEDHVFLCSKTSGSTTWSLYFTGAFVDLTTVNSTGLLSSVRAVVNFRTIHTPQNTCTQPPVDACAGNVTHETTDMTGKTCHSSFTLPYLSDNLSCSTGGGRLLCDADGTSSVDLTPLFA